MVTFSCNQQQERVKISNPTAEQRLYLIQPGEWIDVDNVPKISVREDMLAFYKNGSFRGEDIYHYVIINLEKDKRLQLNGNKDTLEYKILQKNDTLIKLQIDNLTYEYKWSKAIQFK